MHFLPWPVSLLNVLGDSVRVTKTFKSCWPAWLEMHRKVCPTATNTLHFNKKPPQWCSEVRTRLILVRPVF